MDLKKLSVPFSENDVEWRVQSSGDKNGKIWAKVLCYIQNRAIMDRLDEVCGIENWRNEYAKAPDGGILCGISIKIGEEWITKWDGAHNTEVKDSKGNPNTDMNIKGGLSNSMKRAGVQWGIGRYLYHLTVSWADVCGNGEYSSSTTDKKWFKWNPPPLPDWALPKGAVVKKSTKAPVEITQTEKQSGKISINNAKIIIDMLGKIHVTGVEWKAWLKAYCIANKYPAYERAIDIQVEHFDDILEYITKFPDNIKSGTITPF